MKEVNIITAKPDDAETIASLAKEIWEEHYTPIIGAPQVAYMLSKFQSAQAVRHDILSGMNYEIAFCEGHPAGYSASRFDKANRKMFLSKLYVAKPFRGGGIAGKLVERVKAACNAAGGRTVWLTVNRNNLSSIAAYHKLGFEKACEMKTDIGGGFVMDDYRMEKAL